MRISANLKYTPMKETGGKYLFARCSCPGGLAFHEGTKNQLCGKRVQRKSPATVSIETFDRKDHASMPICTFTVQWKN